MVIYDVEEKARAYPGSDARLYRPIGVSNEKQGLPTEQGRGRLKKLALNQATTRFATLNVGSMTGKSREVAAALKARRIDVCAVQETKWAGAKAKDIGEGCKILYNGIARTRNGVGIIVSEKFRDAIFEVERYDDRLMKVVFVIESRKIHFFTAYAPQAGCSALEKEAFWNLLDSKTMLVPADELLFVAGDLNGHVGKHSDGHPAMAALGTAPKTMMATAFWTMPMPMIS